MALPARFQDLPDDLVPRLRSLLDASRARCREKHALADAARSDLLGYESPGAGFFPWLPVPDGEAAALRLWREEGVRVLRGAYLGRDDRAGNPGAGPVRAAPVAPKDDTERGLAAIRRALLH